MHMRERLIFVLVGGGLLLTALLSSFSGTGRVATAQKPPPPKPEVAATVDATKTEVATFAAGCFWCVEADFDSVPGVLKTTPGYTGGHFKNPTYELVATGLTGHTETLEAVFDPSKVSYRQLLKWYWRHVDPTDARGQFCDRGNEYRPAIFVHSEEQKKLAEASKEELEKSGVLDRPVVVKIEDAGTFTVAEMEHHDYYLKHPLRYMFYRAGCGRDQILKRVWSKASG